MPNVPISRIVRPPDERPSLRRVVWRGLVLTVVTARHVCGCSPRSSTGFSIDSLGDALLAGFVVGVANAVVWPALAFLVVPLSVLTLGLGAIVLNALFVLVAARPAAGGRDRRVLDVVRGS